MKGDGESAGADQFYIDMILSRHARKLLSSYRLRDLAFFAANLEDYQLVSWLRKERSVIIGEGRSLGSSFDRINM